MGALHLQNQTVKPKLASRAKMGNGGWHQGQTAAKWWKVLRKSTGLW